MPLNFIKNIFKQPDSSQNSGTFVTVNINPIQTSATQEIQNGTNNNAIPTTLWIEQDFPYLQQNISPSIWEILKEIQNEKNKLDEISDLSLEDNSKIFYLLNHDVKERLSKYLEIPKSEANILIVSNNMTARDLLRDSLNNVKSQLSNIREDYFKQKTKNFLQISEQLEQEAKIAFAKPQYDFTEYYRQVSQNTETGVNKYLQSFNYLNTSESINEHLKRVYAIGLKSLAQVDLLLQKSTIIDMDFLNQHIKKLHEYQNADENIKSIILQEILIEKSKINIIINNLEKILQEEKQLDNELKKDFEILEMTKSKMLNDNFNENLKLEFHNFLNSIEFNHFVQNFVMKHTTLAQNVTIHQLLLNNYQKHNII